MVIKKFNSFNINEASTKDAIISGQAFLDYKSLGKRNFVMDYEDLVEQDPTLVKRIVDLWKNCNIELMLTDEGKLYPSINKIKNMKYPNLYVFGEDIGVPIIYLISSSYDDLHKRVTKPDEQ